MSDFLTRLAERTLGLASPVQPVIPSRYEPGKHIEAAFGAPWPPLGTEETAEADEGAVTNPAFAGPAAPVDAEAEPRVSPDPTPQRIGSRLRASHPDASAQPFSAVGDPRPARPTLDRRAASEPQTSLDPRTIAGDEGMADSSRPLLPRPLTGSPVAPPDPDSRDLSSYPLAGEASERPTAAPEDRPVPGAHGPAIPELATTADRTDDPRRGAARSVDRPDDHTEVLTGAASPTPEPITVESARHGEPPESSPPSARGAEMDRATRAARQSGTNAGRVPSSPKAAPRRHEVAPPLLDPEGWSTSAEPQGAVEFEQARPGARIDRDAVEAPSSHGSVWQAPPAAKMEPPARPIGASDLDASGTAGRVEVGSDLGPRTAPDLGVRREAVPPARPTVQVSIGRIEVRAVRPPPAPPVPHAPVGPRVSLEEYLQERNGGRP